MTRDVHVGRPNLRTSGYVRKRQRHQRVMRHELQNARVKAAQRVAHQATQVGQPPAVDPLIGDAGVDGAGQGKVGHVAYGKPR